MIIKKRKFTGGYTFKNFKGEPSDELVKPEIPERVIIPLKQGFGDEVNAAVKKGDSVTAGQIIGINDESISSPVHSTVNGTVEDIKKAEYFGRLINTVVIKSDVTPDFKPHEAGTSSWKNLPEEKLEEVLYMAGVTSLGRSGIPTRYKSSAILPGEVEHIIIDGVQSDIYNLSLTLLLAGKGLNQFIEGIDILKAIMPRASVHIAVNKYQKSIIKKIDESADNRKINIYPLDPKYPQGYDEVIIPTILGREFPFGFNAFNMGIIVLDIQAVLHVYEAVVLKKPLIERLIALAGPGFTENFHIKVRIGTQIDYIVKNRVKPDTSLRYILNSPLWGNTVTDLSLPVDRTVNCISCLVEDRDGEAFSFARPGISKDSYSKTFAANYFPFKKTINTNTHGEERACIFCNYCQDVCPSGLVPHLLYHYVERDMVDDILLRYRIFNCIDCNLCGYVCPSKINPAMYIKQGREKLTGMGINPKESVLRRFKLKGVKENKQVNSEYYNGDKS
ncbi:MAG: 4Fe-4S dicluster domain-containing protein [Spirochaetes bacterium]|nr:4Fe-4S dicluster domain-containing protein [Spirochaetota bacterium]